MTIIKHTRKPDYLFFACILGLLLIGGGALYVFSYNALVETRHEIAVLRTDIEKSKTAIADYQGELFLLTDPASLKEFAEAEGLILETRPDYVSVRGVAERRDGAR